jgi:hypothetical protein
MVIRQVSGALCVPPDASDCCKRNEVSYIRIFVARSRLYVHPYGIENTSGHTSIAYGNGEYFQGWVRNTAQFWTTPTPVMGSDVGGVRLPTHAKASRMPQRMMKGDEPRAILETANVENKRQVDLYGDVDHK